MKKILVALFLLAPSFALSDSSSELEAADVQMRNNGISEKECRRVWENCYGEIRVVKEMWKADFLVYVESDIAKAKLLIARCNNIADADRRGRWYLTDNVYSTAQRTICFVNRWTDADCTVYFVSRGNEKWNW